LQELTGSKNAMLSMSTDEESSQQSDD